MFGPSGRTDSVEVRVYAMEDSVHERWTDVSQSGLAHCAVYAIIAVAKALAAMLNHDAAELILENGSDGSAAKEYFSGSCRAIMIVTNHKPVPIE